MNFVKKIRNIKRSLDIADLLRVFLTVGFVGYAGLSLGEVRDMNPLSDVSNSILEFNKELFHKLDSNNSNVIYSPFSIHIALTMTRGGAKGKTAEQMDNVLHINGEDKGFHKKYGAFLSHFESYSSEGSDSKGSHLVLANGLWGQKDYGFRGSFIKQLQYSYNSALRLVDFKNHRESARWNINNWVERKTKKRIKNLVPKQSLTSDTRLILTNAIYFKGYWEAPFEPKATKEASFFLNKGEESKVHMMHQSNDFHYYEDQLLQAVDIPYKGKKISMMVILPRKKLSIEKNIPWQDSKWLIKLASGLSSQKVNLYLPKFKMESSWQMKDILQSMGLKDAFKDSADFRGMINDDFIAKGEGLKVGDVIHKAFVEVNEMSTEAAAATAVVMMRTLAMPMQPVIFKADRPFVFLIWEKVSRTVFFVGRVNNPNLGE